MTDVNVPKSRAGTRRGNVISAATYWPLVDAVYGKDDKCLWCGCGFDDHGWSVGRTRWFEPYDPAQHKQRVRWHMSDGTLVVERASRRAQVQVIWCYHCAGQIRTDQVICYQRPPAQGGVEILSAMRAIAPQDKRKGGMMSEHSLCVLALVVISLMLATVTILDFMSVGRRDRLRQLEQRLALIEQERAGRDQSSSQTTAQTAAIPRPRNP